MGCARLQPLWRGFALLAGRRSIRLYIYIGAGGTGVGISLYLAILQLGTDRGVIHGANLRARIGAGNLVTP